jgi:hypothetical protein
MLPIILSCLTLLLLIGFVARLKLSPIAGCPSVGSLFGLATVERLPESLGGLTSCLCRAIWITLSTVAGGQKVSHCWQSRSVGTNYDPAGADTSGVASNHP